MVTYWANQISETARNVRRLFHNRATAKPGNAAICACACVDPPPRARAQPGLRHLQTHASRQRSRYCHWNWFQCRLCACVGGTWHFSPPHVPASPDVRLASSAIRPAPARAIVEATPHNSIQRATRPPQSDSKLSDTARTNDFPELRRAYGHGRYR